MDFLKKIIELIQLLFCKKNNDNSLIINNEKEEKVINNSTIEIIKKDEETIIENNNIIIDTDMTIRKDVTVILDAGHGASTPGKRSPILEDGKQLFEWKFSRELSNRLKIMLENNGIKCIQANIDESDPGLSKRAAHINEIYAEEKKQGRTAIMISLHGNAAGSGDWMSARGWEVWSTEGITKSDDLAQCFVHCFHDVMPEMKLRGHKEKNFTVIYKTNCPCVLTENFFYDNKEDCKFMLSEEGINKIVELHVKAIINYLSK